MSRIAAIFRAAVVALTLAAAPLPAVAQDDAAIAEIRTAWDACTAITDNKEAYWIGWRQDFFNGYGNDFQFYDGRWSNEASVLVQFFATDAIAYETVTSCFRPDGTLAFIHTVMSSPNYAQGGDNGPTIQREGRIYFDRSGKVIRTLGQYSDTDGKKLAELDDETYAMARGCSPVDAHLKADDVETEYFSKLGDIEGKHPAYTPNEYDWCAALGAQ